MTLNTVKIYHHTAKKLRDLNLRLSDVAPSSRNARIIAATLRMVIDVRISQF